MQSTNTHWQVAQAQPHPKLAKEYVLPTLTEEKVRPHNKVYKSLGNK